MNDLRLIWTVQGWLADDNQDDVPDGVRAALIVGRTKRADGEHVGVHRGVVELAGRLGLETSAISFPLLRWDDEGVAFADGDVYVGIEHRAFCEEVIQGWERVEEKRAHLQPGQGYVALVALQQGGHAVVVTGADGQGVYEACAFLAGSVFAVTAEDEPVREWVVEAAFASGRVRRDGTEDDVENEAVASDKSEQTEAGQLEAARLNLAQTLRLETLFTDEGLFQRDEQELPEDVHVIFSCETWTAAETAAIAVLAARIGLEACGLHFPLTGTGAELEAQGAGNGLRIAVQADEAMQATTLNVQEVKGQATLQIQGGDVQAAVDWIVDQLFGPADLAPGRSWKQVAALLQKKEHPLRHRLLAERGLEQFLREQGAGEEAFAAETVETAGASTVHVHLPEAWYNSLTLWEEVAQRAKAHVHFHKMEPAPVLERNWESAGEQVRVYQAVESWLSDAESLAHLPSATPLQDQPDVQKGKELQIKVGVDLSPDSREELKEQLQGLFERHGFVGQVNMRSAWKQGYWWMEHEVVPDLQTVDGVVEMEIRFRPFRPPTGKTSPELSIRWLQELYPIDEIVEQQLGISTERVQFVMDEDQSSTYVVIARDAVGEERKRYSFDPHVTERLYLAGQEQAGVVVPPTGWLQVKAGEVVVYEREMETDLVLFWDFYQQFLTDLTAWLAEGKRELTPLFGRIDCEVRMDAEERTIGVREENFSSLEALHEDVYFNTLDYLSALGRQQGFDWEAPGQVLPWITCAPGERPSASIRVYDLPNLSAGIHVDGNALEPLTVEEFQVRGVRWTEQGVRFAVESDDEATKAMLEAWLAESCAGEGQAKDRAEAGSHAKAPANEVTAPNPSQVPHIPLDEVIDDIRIAAFYDQLAGVPGVHVATVEHSYLGRPIALVEQSLPTKAQHVSRNKLALWKPTVFVNARHHANEVSSTNAILKLVADLADTHRNLLKTCNLVVSAMANPDGVAVHYAMHQANPNWKLHAARYNAAGFEFAKHRYVPDTPYGESRTYEKVWRRWAPDLVIDDHGVPSHEWVQPFSGYNSPPRFPVSYWLPNALIYTITQCLDEQAYPQHATIREQLLQTLAVRMKEHPVIREQNDYWQKRFAKWGTQWLPQTFPLEVVDELITYRWKAKINPHSRNLGERFPALVSVDLITEVADETATGAYLAECATAHYELDLAAVAWVASQRQVVQRERMSTATGAVVRLSRPRPLQMETLRIDAVRTEKR